MKTFLIIASLAGLSFAGFKVLTSGDAPRATLSRVIEVPGAAISRLSLSGGDPGSIVLLIGAVIVVLLTLYLILSR